MTKPVAVVTGGGTGIGQAIAVALAGAGYDIAVAGRKAETLNDTRQRIVQRRGDCLVHPADVSTADGVEGLVRAAKARYGRIDVWVNNAGLGSVRGIAEITAAEIDALLRVNAASVAYACRAVWPEMQRGGGGTIVNISSIAAFDPFPGLEVYGAAKAFVNLLTKGLAAEGKAHNIHVFAVAPGAVETQMLRAGFPDMPDNVCLAPEDVAAVVIELTQPAFRHCTGQTIVVRR